jgi:hypothetical protein
MSVPDRSLEWYKSLVLELSCADKLDDKEIDHLAQMLWMAFRAGQAEGERGARK